jgi:hypothetical protein
VARQERIAHKAISDCKQQLSGLDNALTDLSSLLNVGLNFSDYGTRVGNAQVAYGRTNFSDLSTSCVSNAGIPMENALNDYNSAAQTWNTCFQDLYCTDSSIDGELQAKWGQADGQLRQAHSGYSQVVPSGTDSGTSAGTNSSGA